MFSTKNSDRIAVYTAVFGEYDSLKSPPRDPRCDYFCFCDNPNLKSDIYEVKVVARRYAEAARDARYYKVLSHRCFPKYRFTLWLDASASLKFNKISEFVKTNLSKSNIALHRHPSNDDIYHELERCVAYEKDDPDTMRSQVSRYRAEGYPANSGLVASGAIVRCSFDPAIRRLEKFWWQEIEGGSYRDQLSFNFVAWKLKIPFYTFDTLRFLPGENPQFSSKYFDFWLHRGPEKEHLARKGKN